MRLTHRVRACATALAMTAGLLAVGAPAARADSHVGTANLSNNVFLSGSTSSVDVTVKNLEEDPLAEVHIRPGSGVFEITGGQGPSGGLWTATHTASGIVFSGDLIRQNQEVAFTVNFNVRKLEFDYSNTWIVTARQLVGRELDVDERTVAADPDGALDTVVRILQMQSLSYDAPNKRVVALVKNHSARTVDIRGEAVCGNNRNAVQFTRLSPSRTPASGASTSVPFLDVAPPNRFELFCNILLYVADPADPLNKNKALSGLPVQQIEVQRPNFAITLSPPAGKQAARFGDILVATGTADCTLTPSSAKLVEYDAAGAKRETTVAASAITVDTAGTGLLCPMAGQVTLRNSDFDKLEDGTLGQKLCDTVRGPAAGTAVYTNYCFPTVRAELVVQMTDPIARIIDADPVLSDPDAPVDSVHPVLSKARTTTVGGSPVIEVEASESLVQAGAPQPGSWLVAGHTVSKVEFDADKKVVRLFPGAEPFDHDELPPVTFLIDNDRTLTDAAGNQIQPLSQVTATDGIAPASPCVRGIGGSTTLAVPSLGGECPAATLSATVARPTIDVETNGSAVRLYKDDGDGVFGTTDPKVADCALPGPLPRLPHLHVRFGCTPTADLATQDVTGLRLFAGAVDARSNVSPLAAVLLNIDLPEPPPPPDVTPPTIASAAMCDTDGKVRVVFSENVPNGTDSATFWRFTWTVKNGNLTITEESTFSAIEKVDDKTRLVTLRTVPQGDATNLRLFYEFKPPQRTVNLDPPSRYADAATNEMADHSAVATRGC